MIIATDLDGTLFFPKSKIKMIGKRNRKFIERFLADGGKLVIVSSRNHYYNEKVAKNLGYPLDFICCNGGLIVSNGKVIRKKTFESKTALKILNEMWDHHDTTFVCSCSEEHNMVLASKKNGFVSNWLYGIYQLAQGIYREPTIKDTKIFYDDLLNDRTYKFLTMMGIWPKTKNQAKELNKVLRQKFPEAEFSWCNQAIEITPKGCSKGEALEFYLDYNSIPHDNVLVIGDSGNDISMFNRFQKNSFCLEHGSQTIKKHASHVIKRFYDLEKYIYPSVEK